MSDSELLTLIDRAWKIYKVLSRGPDDFEPACNGLLSMIAGLREINDIVSQYHISTSDTEALSDFRGRCDAVLLSVEGALTRFKISRHDAMGLVDCVDRVQNFSIQLSSFLEEMRDRYSRQRLVEALEQLVDRSSEESLRDFISNWTLLYAELRDLGLSVDTIDDDYFFIHTFLQERTSELHGLVEEEDELPDYTPGSAPPVFTEKTRVLGIEEATKQMFLGGKDTDPGPTSSLASPPPYTFDNDADQGIDEAFVKKIRQAVQIETDRRSFNVEQDPSWRAGPQPYSWLPYDTQTEFLGKNYLKPALDADSFSAMSYITVPYCVEKVERFANLLSVSFDHKANSASEIVVVEAPATLRTMSLALTKFALLQDQKAHHAIFSDLDSLEYEYTTALSRDEMLNVYGFPAKELNLARESCYTLLTFIMGVLQVFSEIFEGRSYLTRALPEVEALWKERNMSARKPWIEKRLAAWTEVENAILQCRNVHSLRPDLRAQALRALDDWKAAEAIFSGRSYNDVVLLTVKSASGLPKPSIGKLSTFVRVVFYGKNETTGGAMRLFDLKTEISNKSQTPVWNREFNLDVSRDSRFLDLELYDKVAGIDKFIGRRRLEISFKPGAEATFANRDLVYKCDEVIDFPLKMPADHKGKGKDPPTIKVGLKWQGRFAKVQEMGLPLTPPGKMFKSEITGLYL